MDSCDVLIVGGGPAGSSCAWGLRNSGLRVVTLDKERFPRDKVCGGWITPRVLTDLEIDSVEYSRARVLQPITGFRVGRIGGSAVKVTYGSPVSYGIRRREFDDFLLRRSGAQLRLGEPLTRLERSADGWIANAGIQARVVVGAGGHFCPVAHFLGAKTGGEPAVVAQEAEFEMDRRQMDACQVQGDTPELYFCNDLLGYGWCFRKGNVLNVGLGRADPHRLTDHVHAFMRFLRAGRIGFDVPHLHGHAYLLRGTSVRHDVDHGVLLIGDAAGLASPQSGEGIRPAVESGLLAARTLVAARGVYTKAQLGLSLAPRHASARSWLQSAGYAVPAAILRFFATRLLAMPWFARKIVLEKWFLHGMDGASAA